MSLLAMSARCLRSALRANATNAWSAAAAVGAAREPWSALQVLHTQPGSDDSTPSFSGRVAATSWQQQRHQMELPSCVRYFQAHSDRPTAAHQQMQNWNQVSKPSTPGCDPPMFSSPSSRAAADTAPQPALIISPVACRVVVIGWMGSRRKYLNKYRSLWMRSGDHAVLMIRPSIFQTVFRLRGIVTAGSDLDRIAKLHNQNPAMPTIYHVFSMGGFIHLGTIWRWMDEVEDVGMRRDLLEEVKGIILDSAPCQINEDIAARAITSALTWQSAAGPDDAAPSIYGFFARSLQPLLRRILNRKSSKLRSSEVYDAWYHLAPYCPQLYLYSETDPLVSREDVEQYIKQQKSRGVEVSAFRWNGSGHCEHYKRFPHEYAYQVSSFLSRALRGW